MASFYNFLILSAIALLPGSFAQLSTNKEELLNWCLKSKNHKHAPGKEDALHGQCAPWKEHACCTQNVALDVHSTDMYNFTLDHCGNRVMSEQCRRHFVQDNCFYECEPHLGLWVVGVNRKIASERFYKVPLCASDCERWFEDCKHDYTCAYNWPMDFKFSQGHNTCQEGAKCATFKEIYGAAKDFCENVWDHSWSYTPDDQPCIHMWFDASSENPNRKVAEFYVEMKFDTSGAGFAFFPLGVWLLVPLVAILWS